MDECDGASGGGFRRNVTHHHAPGAARKPAIGDQPHRFTQPLSNQRTGRCQHLWHAGSTLGTQVAQNHHVTSHNFPGQDGSQRRLLVVKNACRAGHHRVLQPGDFCHATLGRQIALENRQVALGIHWVVYWPDHVLIGAWYVGDVLEHFGNGLAADRDAVAMQQARYQQRLHDLRNASGFVQVYRQVLAARF